MVAPVPALGAEPSASCSYDSALKEIVCPTISTTTATATRADGSNNVISSNPNPGPPQLGDCRYKPLGIQPDPSSPTWGRGSDGSGAVYSRFCFIPPTNVMADNPSPGVTAWRWVDYQYLADGASPLPAVPDNATDVVERYFQDSRRLPSPTIHVGPNPAELAVKVPVWFWVADPEVEPLVVNGFLVSVTATPTVSSTTWEVKEPLDNPDRVLKYHYPAAITCDGLGSRPPAELTREIEPPCGHTFRWRSTADRTADDCAWPVTATITWTIPWTATTGQSGTLTSQTSTTTYLTIGEWRTVLVSDPSWEPPPQQKDPRCRY